MNTSVPTPERRALTWMYVRITSPSSSLEQARKISIAASSVNMNTASGSSASEYKNCQLPGLAHSVLRVNQNPIVNEPDAVNPAPEGTE